MIKTNNFFFGLLLALGCWSCGDDNLDDDLNNMVLKEVAVVINPSGYAPLTASVTLETTQPTAVELRVVGRNGSDSDVVQRFSAVQSNHTLMVLGLYADYQNQVELTFFDADGKRLATETLEITTRPLFSGAPQIEINTLKADKIKPGMNLVSYFGHDGSGVLPQRPFIFDNFGDIRWYLDYRSHPMLNTLFMDVGMFPAKNGNLIFGNNNYPAIFEVNRYGEVLQSWDLVGYSFHHMVIEKPNGNLLVTVNENGKATVEDVILELDRSNGAIVNKWDLTLSLDPLRRAWETNLADTDIDWFHANALVWDETDNTLVVSGRTQGLVKLTPNNEVVWILAPHRDWTVASDGTDLTQYLLQPLDAQGNPIQDPQVLDGSINHPDFEWSWYQHGPVYLPNRNLVVFDNGDNRNYTLNERYSRAVEYTIDEVNKTIQQVWQYGKERGAETYSRIVSKVDHHVAENNIFFTSGSISYNGSIYGKAVEINRATDEVVFEATITGPTTLFIITFHNVRRIGLYAN